MLPSNHSFFSITPCKVFTLNPFCILFGISSLLLFWLLSKLEKTINTFLELEISVVCREFSAFKYVSIFFFSKQIRWLSYNLYIRNLEHSRLKPVFRYTISIYICVGRLRILNKYCVVKKCFKCAIFKFSVVQIVLNTSFKISDLLKIFQTPIW